MIVNWNLLKQPLNWIIVILMLVIAGMAGSLVLSYAGLTPANSSNS